MAATFLAKRGTINIYRASSLLSDYNNSARSVANGVTIATSSRCFASQGDNEREKSKEEGMGTTTDGKAPNVTMNHAADASKDGMKRAIDAAIEESGDASKQKKSGGDEENVAVAENGTVQGENQSSG